MKTFAKLKFWSFLIFGILFMILGTFFFITDKASEAITNMLFIAGAGQLVWFYGLLFYLYKGKINNAIKA